MPPFDYRQAIDDARRAFRVRSEPSLTVLDAWGEFLAGSEGDVTSQNGEDGVLAALFDRIGALNRRCFDVGAADGVRLSNTWALRRDGWASLLIEADDALYERLLSRCWNSARVVHERVEPGDLDRLLAEADAPADLDLGVIDVDGIDAALWEGMKAYRPRVVLIEFNPSGDGIQGGTTQWQAGLGTVAKVGAAKGYRLVARTYHNAFFVTEEAIEGAP